MRERRTRGSPAAGRGTRGVGEEEGQGGVVLPAFLGAAADVPADGTHELAHLLAGKR